MNHHKRRKMKIYDMIFAKLEQPVVEQVIEEVKEEVKEEAQVTESILSTEEAKPAKKKKSSV
jgi:hypothetical protein